MRFLEAFARSFGAEVKVTRAFPGPKAEITFIPPARKIHMVKFYSGDSWVRHYDGTMMLRVYRGDELVAENEDIISGYVNATDRDPWLDIDESHNWAFDEVAIDRRNMIWYEPGVEYRIEVERMEGGEDPISLTYTAYSSEDLESPLGQIDDYTKRPEAVAGVESVIINGVEYVPK